MPIRRDLRHFYRCPEWRAARVRILARAGNRCENCLVPNRVTVLRMFGWWTKATLEATVYAQGGSINGSRIIALDWHCANDQGMPVEVKACFPRSKLMHSVGIVLTVAHLNHVAGDERDENLMALCQWCHLHYDRAQHSQTRCKRKDATRPLIAEEA